MLSLKLILDLCCFRELQNNEITGLENGAFRGLSALLRLLGAAHSRFLKPVRSGDRVIATARTVQTDGKKYEVRVEAAVGPAKVFEGTFTCIALERHVLDRAGGE